jgi:hypothetical protein
MHQITPHLLWLGHAVAAAAFAWIFQDSEDECLKQFAEHFPTDMSPALWHDIKSIIEEQIL